MGELVPPDLVERPVSLPSLPPGQDALALFGDSEVGRDLAAVDWAATPLGPPAQWPQSLVTVVRVLLSSRFPMWMAWGEDLTLLCNDAYRPILGSKYEGALGRPTREVWHEIWTDIGPRIERVMSTGESTWDEALQLFVERSGYREEAYFTFSYSPLADDGGDVVGMFCVVSEETRGVVGNRSLATVRDLGTRVTGARTRQEVLAAGAEQLATDPLSLPFTLSYLLDDDGERAVLAACSGVEDGHDVAVPVVTPDDGTWPLAEVLAGRTAVVPDLGRRFRSVPSGGWPEPPTTALVVPFRQRGQERPSGFLVAGTNPYRPLDEDQTGFAELVAAQLGAGLASALAYEQERERVARLEELDRSKTAFFTNVSHEFRTPLTLLLGPAEDALADTEQPLTGVQRERLELVQRNGERLLKLVNSLLDLSRLESGTLSAAFEPVDLAGLTRELAGAFSAAVERVGLTLELDLPPLPEPVWVDREMWSKVVLNLLSNALKATFSGGITVSLHVDGDAVRLDVADTGTGIAPEHQPRLFERFVRVPGAASRSHEGSGIGLALVADLAAAHGGTVAVDSEPGRGSTFTVRVPLGRDHLPADAVVEAPAAPDGQASRSARGFLAEALRWLRGGAQDVAAQPEQDDRPTVLVVDDNADMRDHVARLLSPGHVVLTAEDGRAGLQVALSSAPDLVLSDVMMPHLDGFGLLRALREDPRTTHTPVVLLSARAGEEATVEGLDAGADDYLVKPFSGRELLARVRANLELERGRRTRRALERSQELLDQAQRLAGVGSFELDLTSGAVTPSQEFLRQLQLTAEELADDGLAFVLEHRVHPDERAHVEAQVQSAMQGEDLDYETRVVLPGGDVRTFVTRAVVERDEDGAVRWVRGSNQDVTEQRRTEQSLADAQAAREVAARERRIADELQRSLLPAVDVQPEALEVAAFYRAGAEGTQVGGDWYDVIELGAGRTALVLGDVMGRGVRAAAVMGQLRSAVRAYAGLDLPPADVLENLDGVVRFLGDDQIVTCLYAVYDPYDGTLTHANAGHLPPLVRDPGGSVRRLDTAAGAPLGAGGEGLTEQTVALAPGSVVALYTDGLVERRDADLDEGIEALAGLLSGPVDDLAALPAALVQGLRPEGPDDDIAVLLARAEPPPSTGVLTRDVPDDLRAVRAVRHEVRDALRSWEVGEELLDAVLLLLSELVTNGLVHGRPPVSVRLRLTARTLVLEVHDAASYLPRRRRPGADDEHGRGLQLVSALSERWGTRPTADGKAVWCVLPR